MKEFGWIKRLSQTSSIFSDAVENFKIGKAREPELSSYPADIKSHGEKYFNLGVYFCVQFRAN